MARRGTVFNAAIAQDVNERHRAGQFRALEKYRDVVVKFGESCPRRCQSFGSSVSAKGFEAGKAPPGRANHID